MDKCITDMDKYIIDTDKYVSSNKMHISKTAFVQKPGRASEDKCHVTDILVRGQKIPLAIVMDGHCYSFDETEIDSICENMKLFLKHNKIWSSTLKTGLVKLYKHNPDIISSFNSIVTSNCTMIELANVCSIIKQNVCKYIENGNLSQSDVIPSDHIVNAITELPLFVQHQIDNDKPNDVETFKKTLESACIKFDTDMYNRKFKYGTTCVMYLIDRVITNNIYLVNIGDSRGIVFNKYTGKIICKTIDHKPRDKQEVERIQKSGNFVFGGRIGGDLAVSRGFGDYGFKKTKIRQYDPIDGAVSAVPDVYNTDIDDSVAIMLSSDSAFEKYNNEEILSMLLQFSNNDLKMENLKESVEKLINSFHGDKYGGDDSTIVVTIV